jgi:cytochrome P450
MKSKLIFEGTSSRSLTMDDLNELKYLECVLKEALRIYPAVPIIHREFTEDCTIGKC